MSFVDELRKITLKEEAQWREEQSDRRAHAAAILDAAMKAVDVQRVMREMHRRAAQPACEDMATGARYWEVRLCVVTGDPVMLWSTFSEVVGKYVLDTYGPGILPRLVRDQWVNSRPRAGAHMFVELRWTADV